MDPFTWKRKNRAPLNIITNSWAHQVHKLVHSGAITLEQAATIFEDASVQTYNDLERWEGPLTGRGTTSEAQNETEALISGRDPDDDTDGPEAFSQPCFESLAVLMGMSVQDLQGLTKGLPDTTPSTATPVSPVGEGSGGAAQQQAQKGEDNNYSGA